ncbi:related to DUF757 domain protein [Melanopsichium pennsylvanicum]|uniref:Related to DUF757 domain protein n=2 Tax=Melanopsichium pennsylvanicum TaxID=63383 RepID=A0AAJ4XI18_9BASI|nr:duf757-domain-containing protein [Melanopsichium pennsylvanicum 4]SNX82407.1 related to DUF757 domain protein [Melanopsichium pennsylvanicum]
MSTATFDANKAQNLPEIEKQMAVRCVEHAQTYWNLLEKIKPSTLRLTKRVPVSPTQPSYLLVAMLDDEMYEDFQATFPEFSESSDPKSVLKIDEEAMKSPAGKEKWRGFINKYENKVADYNFGTLIRTDATDEYTQFNTTFVTRLQFYVYEIARCRRGLNDWVYEKAQKEAAREKANKTAQSSK